VVAEYEHGLPGVSDSTKLDSNASHRPEVIQNKVFSDFLKSTNNQEKEAGHLEVEAVLASSLASPTRYRSGLKRDLYKANEMLRAAQKNRRDREQ
jgi:hypothetical protein